MGGEKSSQGKNTNYSIRLQFARKNTSGKQSSGSWLARWPRVARFNSAWQCVASGCRRGGSRAIKGTTRPTIETCQRGRKLEVDRGKGMWQGAKALAWGLLDSRATCEGSESSEKYSISSGKCHQQWQWQWYQHYHHHQQQQAQPNVPPNALDR